MAIAFPYQLHWQHCKQTNNANGKARRSICLPTLTAADVVVLVVERCQWQCLYVCARVCVSVNLCSAVKSQLICFIYANCKPRGKWTEAKSVNPQIFIKNCVQNALSNFIQSETSGEGLTVNVKCFLLKLRFEKMPHFNVWWKINVDMCEIFLE